MSAVIHPFPRRDPREASHPSSEELLSELAEAVGHGASPATPTTAGAPGRPGASVTPVGRARTGGANDLVVIGPSTVTGRRRLVAVATALLVLVAAFVLLTGLGDAGADANPETAPTAMLEDGDTLWGLAEDVTPPGGDVRATVATIMDLNDFSSPSLQPGTIVRLPEPAR